MLNGNGHKSAEQILDEQDDGYAATEQREALAKAIRQADLLRRFQELVALNPLEREVEAKKLAKELNVRVFVIREMITKTEQLGNPFQHSNGCTENPTATVTWDPLKEHGLAVGIIKHSNDPLALLREAAKPAYAGDLTPVELIYVAATSRLLDRPISLQALAQSAAGKNYTVDTALQFVPPECYYKLSASSPRALIYTGESFEHRSVILAECDSIPREGPAASAIRSIVNDAEMVYEVVEKNSVTGKQEVRRIIKTGPTNLITTGVRTMDTQMGTRLLTIGIPDSAEQTRAVLDAEGKLAAGAVRSTISESDQVKFWAFQRWLGCVTKGAEEFWFAQALAGLVPVNAVRMRRDFRQLLSMVKTMAVLHQERREKTGEGLVVATIEDYSESAGC